MTPAPLQRLFTLIAHLLYPPRCPLCAAFVSRRDQLCDPCDAGLARLEGDAHLALPVRVWLSRARSCFAYDGPIRDALHAFKYAGRGHAARFFARSLAEEVPRVGGFDLLIPVPMHPAHLLARGQNAAALLAARLAPLCGVRLERGVLRKIARTPPQVGLSRAERHENLRGAFAVAARRHGRIDGARILLIDDILTTGSTANECARALLQAGAGEVAMLSVARAL